MTLQQFGQEVMQWGRGDGSAAIARKETITRDWLVRHGVTREMMLGWQRKYLWEYARNNGNTSALGRAELCAHCADLLDSEAR
jgi:hypothetical protein